MVEKFWQLLLPAERRRALVLVLLMLVGMLFETVGVGLVVPALALMSRADLALRYPAVAPLLQALGNPSQSQLVVFGMFTLAAVYLIKALFLSFLTWRQMRFVYALQADFSQRLFIAYLRQPYTFHIQRNSAQLIRNAIREVDILTQNGVLQSLTFITEALVIAGVVLLLLYVEPIGALLAFGALALFGWGFYRVMRTPTLQWGRDRQLHEGMRIQHLQQGLGGIKDVKVLGREQEFVAQFGVHARGAARVGGLQQTMTLLPRLGLEVVAVLILAVIVAVLIGQGRGVNELLPTLGLFAAAAFRVIPSANRLISAVQIIRNSLPSVDVLHEEIQGLQHVRAPAAGGLQSRFAEALTFEDVEFAYPAEERTVVCGVTLRVAVGETVGIIGESGAGKSTLVDLLLGLLQPTRGAIRIDGVDIHADIRSWQDRLGYVPQTVYLTDDTLRRNIAFGIADAAIDDAAVWRAARLAQIDKFIRELPNGLHTKVGERGVRLSGGQLQRVGIARALYHDPDVLVLDEATSSLDTLTERGVMEAVRALHGEKTIVIVAHRLSTVEQCDRLLQMEQGRIVQTGKPAQLLAELRGAARMSNE